jgi:Zn-dependent peptidase ImmA (M78 family)
MSNCKPDYKRAEREALSLLKKMGYYLPPVNPIEIAKKLGIEVREVIFEGRDDVSGMYDYNKNTIYCNKKDAATRQLFTIAHELGHYILHEEYIKNDTEYKVLLRSPHDGDKYELEADAFAANLMMPKFMIDKFSTTRIERLAAMFCVSLPAINNRLAFLKRFNMFVNKKYEQWY